MLVGVLAFEIGFTGIHMSFTFVIKVVLGIIFGHDITSLVVWLVVGCFCSV
jgi:hypothetical protein